MSHCHLLEFSVQSLVRFASLRKFIWQHRRLLGEGLQLGLDVGTVGVVVVEARLVVMRLLWGGWKAQLEAHHRILFSEFLVDFNESEGLFFASEAASASALAIFQ